MCLAIIALNAHPRYRLVVAANRDEFHARDADPAAWWPEGILAEETAWTRHVAWHHASRTLVSADEFSRRRRARSHCAVTGRTRHGRLAQRCAALINAASIASDGARYHGFSLLVGDREQVAYASNRASGAMLLSHGVHGLSNHLSIRPGQSFAAHRARYAWIDKGGVDIDQSSNCLPIARRHFRHICRPPASRRIGNEYCRAYSSPRRTTARDAFNGVDDHP